jgi:hypothetical protein
MSEHTSGIGIKFFLISNMLNEGSPQHTLLTSNFNFSKEILFCANATAIRQEGMILSYFNTIINQGRVLFLTLIVKAVINNELKVGGRFCLRK